MVRIERGVEPEEVRQAAKHTLFVEGKNESAIDPRVLTNLLKDIPIQIKPLGSSSYIRSVAEALHRHHPYYYFLVDRDHHNEQTVEECWQKFPHEDTCNLLIWRRRELESYFLMPEYLLKSQWLRASEEELKTCIRETARSRAFLDAANMVIVGCREEMKKNWIEVFRSVNDGSFETREKALEQLLNRDSFAQKEGEVRKKLHRNFITEMFNQTVDMLSGGSTFLEFGQGKWLEMVSGKSVLHTIVNRCFQVRDAKGHTVQGNERLMEVVEGLLRLPLEEQPDDFQALCRLINEQVK
ncbi:MAG TPA: hypothetical protein VNG51_27420 [Ktedonobacteraceae bacterium]|nr:hypothetical protein [Ktedonobacteraceae bacterium]